MLLKPARHSEASAEADGQFGIFNAQHFMNLFQKWPKLLEKDFLRVIQRCIGKENGY